MLDNTGKCAGVAPSCSTEEGAQPLALPQHSRRQAHCWRWGLRRACLQGSALLAVAGFPEGGDAVVGSELWRAAQISQVTIA